MRPVFLHLLPVARGKIEGSRYDSDSTGGYNNNI
uniref:Translational initiation factor 1 n=2 Tax=Citrus TaxID=2706 RepID=A0A8K1Z2H2_9ROSI|nr:translation initiation factor 1 [Citrus x aurantium]YP_010408299.1 translational initiation factor 1 [Citrus junos]YP_010408386.1 translational initiation factor 1 [Citrus keraji]YP_010408475.1 translational initiation factor 1 [Citrus madurensis]YP_010408563.1 translational initiation factor 1 [Citrus mangshanensis]YP_010408650.1 translational initiation factor 1 [Citrus oto]YP_010408738.1 translational initiation factor 1 [Citrus tachibana]YP_010408825.1 translational initiation factor 